MSSSTPERRAADADPAVADAAVGSVTATLAATVGALPPVRDFPAGHQEIRRAHLLAEATGRTRRPKREIRRRLVLSGLTTAGLAAGLAAALVVAPTSKVTDRSPTETAPTTTTESAEADVILLRAAKAAAAESAPRPRPGQFLYRESKGQTLAIYGGRPVSYGIRSSHRRIWLPADSQQAGLLYTDGEDPRWLCEGRQVEGYEPRPHELPGYKVDLDHPPTGCHRVGSLYEPGLPADPDRMLAWIYQHAGGENPPDVRAFTKVGDMVREKILEPEALAALFTAAARIPGATVTQDIVDPIGRPAVAVGRTWRGMREELLFDPKTYRYLGGRWVVADTAMLEQLGAPMPPEAAKRMRLRPVERPTVGTAFSWHVLLRTAVTDRAGQRPPAG